MPLSLTLKNFRCWEDQTFTFNDDGIILLSGISGKGKSTILNAFLYVITGQVKNVTMFGKEKTKSEVTLSINDDNETVTITRGKNPTRFYVKKDSELFENDIAQSMIDKLFGADFKHVSYIDQDNVNSFVYLTPDAKMTFLRNLLLSNEPIDAFKDNAKSRLDNSKKEMVAEESKITTSTSFLKSMTFVENHTYSLQGKRVITNSNYQETLELQQTNLDKSKKNKMTLTTKLRKMEEDQKKFHEQSKLLDKINELEEQLKTIGELSTMKVELEHLAKQKSIHEQHTEYFEKKKKHKENVQLFSEYEQKMKEFSIEQFLKIKPLEKLISIQQRIVELEDKIGEEKETEIRLKKDKCIEEIKSLETTYICPSCEECLIINDGALVKSGSVFNKKTPNDSTLELKKKQKQLELLQKEEHSIERFTEEYNELFDQFDTLLQTLEFSSEDNFHDKLEKLKKDEKTVSILKSKRSDIEKKITDYNHEEKDEYTEQDSDLVHIVEQITTLKDSIKRANEWNTKLITLKTQKIDVNDIEDQNEQINETKQKLTDYEEKIETYTKYINELQTWKRIEDTNQKYSELKTIIDRSKDTKDFLMEEIKCCEKLLYYMKDAETKAIFDFIDSLNRHAAIYMEDFFPDEDISAELVTNKELKSGKDKVGLFFEVNYKTIKGDMEFLSGGQRDRVNLAFTLAFCELVQNRVLLLDECISSLDNETSDLVIETLKEKYKGKMIICVAHQVNIGVFDQVIKI